MKLKVRYLAAVAALLTAGQAWATVYTMPSANQSLVGDLQYTVAAADDTAAKLGQRYDIGFGAIQSANPHIDVVKEMTYGTQLQIPTQHLLPNHPREGIVVNLPEMRMYYYLNGKVLTYPVGIGKIGKTIPITKTTITRKVKDPVWIPPQDIREFNLEQGIVLPRIMPAGPDNPLGPYAIYMGIPTYLIHSTIFPESVGKRASFGCLRMFESDIQEFFPSINKGIPVVIVNEPTKVGWENSHLFVETHQPLEEHNGAYDATLPGMVHIVANATDDSDALVDWQLLYYLAQERDGIPHDVGVKLPQGTSETQNAS